MTRAETVTMGYLEFLDLVLEEDYRHHAKGEDSRNAHKLSGLAHKTADELLLLVGDGWQASRSVGVGR